MNQDSFPPPRRTEPRKVCGVCGQVVDVIYRDPQRRTELIFHDHMGRDYKSRCQGSGQTFLQEER